MILYILDQVRGFFNAKLRSALIVVAHPNIINLFKFVFIATGHPFIVCVYIRSLTYLPYKIGFGAYYSMVKNMVNNEVLFFLLFALLFYAVWLVMLACIFKIIKPKLNIESFLNAKLSSAPFTLSFFCYLLVLIFFLMTMTKYGEVLVFFLAVPIILIMSLLICISFGMFCSNLINVLTGKYNYK